MPTPKVSVSITTYNHAAFIRLALDGVLRQQTDFPVEILVGEDESTDGTREIVQEYAARFPDRINAFYHTAESKLRIKGRLTGRNNLAHNLNVARGEYIALLDGDDCWTDDTKLARQVAQLDADATLATSFHHALVIDDAGLPLESAPTIRRIKERYTLTEMLAGEFEAQTCTVLFRREAIQPLPAWFFEAPAGDLVISVLNGHRGDFGFIDRVMASYRIHAGGIWSQGKATSSKKDHSPEETKRLIARYEMMVELLQLAARHSSPPNRATAHGRLALYAATAAKMSGRLGDKAGIRRNLGAIWQVRCWPPNLPWKVLARLVLRSVW